MRTHRLYNIGKTEDACLDQDIAIFQAPGIAGAIQPFMVLQYDFCDRPGKVDSFQNVVAYLGMGTDYPSLDITDVTGFTEYLGGNIDFPQIMDRRRHID